MARLASNEFLPLKEWDWPGKKIQELSIVLLENVDPGKMISFMDP